MSSTHDTSQSDDPWEKLAEHRDIVEDIAEMDSPLGERARKALVRLDERQDGDES